MNGGVAETEGARAGREEELVMAPVPPEGCRVCVREGGEVDGDTMMDKIEKVVVLQLMELVDDGMKDRRWM